MAKSGPIVIVEDDIDDQELLKEVLQNLGMTNKLILFDNCSEAFAYLKATNDSPFLIISDVNLPKQSGIDFKKDIDADPQLRQKSIPFVFLSTAVSQQTVNEAYSKMSVQGFFQKANSFTDLKKIIQIIMDYWSYCHHPNS